jgi:hypothetical protein
MNAETLPDHVQTATANTGAPDAAQSWRERWSVWSRRGFAAWLRLRGQRHTWRRPRQYISVRRARCRLADRDAVRHGSADLLPRVAATSRTASAMAGETADAAGKQGARWMADRVGKVHRATYSRGGKENLPSQRPLKPLRRNWSINLASCTMMNGAAIAAAAIGKA